MDSLHTEEKYSKRLLWVTLFVEYHVQSKAYNAENLLQNGHCCAKQSFNSFASIEVINAF